MSDKKEKMKRNAIRRSMLLNVIGVPMMLVSGLSHESIVCLIVVTVYIVLLVLNGIFCLPYLKEIMGEKNKTE